MGTITLELDLDDATWEVIQKRARRSYEEMRKEMEEIGEDYTFEDEVKNQLLYIIDRDVEMYDVYDEVRNSAEVQNAVRRETKKVVERELQKLGIKNGRKYRCELHDKQGDKG